jgi:hypothetical protein
VGVAQNSTLNLKLKTSILRTVFVKMLKTLATPLALALTLNPSPKQGEGLQSGSPSPCLRERVGDEGGSAQKYPDY